MSSEETVEPIEFVEFADLYRRACGNGLSPTAQARWLFTALKENGNIGDLDELDDLEEEEEARNV